MLNGTCAPSMTTGTRLAPVSTSKRSMRPGRRAAARVSPSRSAAPTGSPEAPAHALAAKLAEDGGGEREVDLFDRGRGVEAAVRFTREPSSSARA